MEIVENSNIFDADSDGDNNNDQPLIEEDKIPLSQKVDRRNGRSRDFKASITLSHSQMTNNIGLNVSQSILYGRKKARIFLIFFSICSFIGTVLIVTSEVVRVFDIEFIDESSLLTLGLNFENLMLLLGVAVKSISMIPFLTFEYYLLLF